MILLGSESPPHWVDLASGGDKLNGIPWVGASWKNELGWNKKLAEQMKINQQYQSLHTPGQSEVDWVLVQQIERDICLLYHQLAEYSYIMGDLYYGNVYTFPYWEYLDLSRLDESQRSFVRDGCLVMILAMCWDQIDGSGAYIENHLAACAASVSTVNVQDEDTRKLVGTVSLALRLVKEGSAESQELIDLSSWVHETYVKGYFRRTAREFDANPYFKAGHGDQPTMPPTVQ